MFRWRYRQQKKEYGEEKLLRAQIVSDLVTIQQKTGIGRLSAFCGSVYAGCGADAGILGDRMYTQNQEFLSGDGIVVKGIDNTIRNIGRLVKDGMSCTEIQILKMMLEPTRDQQLTFLDKNRMPGLPCTCDHSEIIERRFARMHVRRFFRSMCLMLCEKECGGWKHEHAERMDVHLAWGTDIPIRTRVHLNYFYLRKAFRHFRNAAFHLDFWILNKLEVISLFQPFDQRGHQ